MSALQPDQVRAMRRTVSRASETSEVLVQRWEKLHQHALELAQLANLASERSPMDTPTFTARLDAVADWQHALVWQGIDDIEAMMRPGLAALRTLTARGQDAHAPTLALWREFHRARGAVLMVLEPGEQSAAA